MLLAPYFKSQFFLQLVDLSAAQDIEAGDGTTSVVVLAGSLLGAAERMLDKGIHPTIVAESFLKASAKAVEYLTEISTPVDLNDRESLLRAATTSLNSKVRCHLEVLFCFI
jgi:T-complex protein 1 subunit delta